MDIVSMINDKINKLAKLNMISGVQPSDLADNIYLENYHSMSSYKNYNCIIFELTFEEEIDNIKTTTLLRYIYNTEKVLYRIEEEINGEIMIQWDREIIERQLINDMVDLLNQHFSKKQVDKFLSTVPLYLKEKILTKLNMVA